MVQMMAWTKVEIEGIVKDVSDSFERFIPKNMERFRQEYRREQMGCDWKAGIL